MTFKTVLVAATSVSALLLGACQTTTTDSTYSSDAASSSSADASTASYSSSSSYDAVATAAGYPADAQPGQCFARILVPDQTEVVTESVVDQPEGAEIKIIPAQYETVTEQVMVKEASTELRVIPARYETVTEQVLVQDEVRNQTVIPASYETYEEQVLVREAYTTWKPGAGLFGASAASAADGSTVPTGEILCKVEVPAEYRTVSRKRLVSAERVDETIIPARYETITKEVLVEPARTEEITIPAVYESRSVQKLVTPAREETIVIPATYKTIERTQVVSKGQLEWREVLCETNTTPAKIAEIQRALSDRGYYKGAADGVFGASTLRAMEAFQRDNGLIIGQLTRETVQALGVAFETSI